MGSPSVERTIIVLGHRLTSPRPHPELLARLTAAWQADLRGGTNALFIVSGGRSNPEVPATEAAVMAEELVRQGASPKRILMEEASLDTIGNAYFSRLLADANRVPRSVLLITSCYHAPRAREAFRMCFEPDYELHSGPCADAGDEASAAGEAPRYLQLRSFFNGIQPGDIEAIGRRLRTAHALYRGRVAL